VTLPLSDALAFSSLLFAVGAGGLLARRSLLFMLASVEVMFVAAGIAFVAVSASQGDVDGQVVYFFVLAAAAAQVSVGLSLILTMHRRAHTIDADRADTMRG
jgi:NADH-quinone oxidoreductase subunit K